LRHPGVRKTTLLPFCVFAVLGAVTPAHAQSTEPSFTAETRWQWYLHRTFGWDRLGMLVGDTAIDHLFRSPSEWDRRPSNFAVRYSAAFGRRLAANTIELGAGLALGEDTRRKPSHERRFSRRLLFAVTGAAAAEDRHGHRRFAFSRLAATMGGNALSATWYPCARTPERFALGLADSYVGQLQNSLLTEFGPDMARFGRKLGRTLLRRPTVSPAPAATATPGM
jgi:hypothetical protein